jgi:DNA-binding NtrC family response regulator
MNLQNSRVFETVSILYIEDDSTDIAFLVSEVLSKIPDPVFDLDVANSIADAKDRYYKKTYDIVLLDMNLPNGQGMESVEKVLDFARSIPVVILSEFDDEALARRAVKKGVQDYLIKGEFNSRGFKRAVNHALYRNESRKKVSEVRERVKAQAIARLRSVVEL